MRLVLTILERAILHFQAGELGIGPPCPSQLLGPYILPCSLSVPKALSLSLKRRGKHATPFSQGRGMDGAPNKVYPPKSQTFPLDPFFTHSWWLEWFYAASF